jgi:hypothetical protein
MRIKVKDIKVGMKIKANIWGLSKTEGREVLTMETMRSGARITIAGWKEPIGLSANTRIDI